jgi:hypothetical protein
MKKVHIVSFGYRDYAFTSIAKAADAVKFLATLTPVKFTYVSGDGPAYYIPDPETQHHDVKLELNQNFRDAEKPEKAAKTLALPKPKRGTIRCICGFSDVAPKQSCVHCGKPFSESHNRTHSSKDNGPNLRLI